MKRNKSFELVLIGHPDCACDLVSKTIAEDNRGGRNAIECMWGNKLFVVSGETDKRWTTPELEQVVRFVLYNYVGLTEEELTEIQVLNNLNVQSQEINDIVGEKGTGDNGIYFGGYHIVYSPVIEKMKDMCVALNNKLLKSFGYRTDGKFIFDVDEDGTITDLTLNIASFENKDLKPSAMQLRQFIQTFTGTQTRIAINPKGDWHKCFGFADTGLTGRKLACQGSCGLFSHGGGAMHGKDLSKADVTVPLYLQQLAKEYMTAPRRSGKLKKKETVFSASSIIGDETLKVYQDGEYYNDVSFEVMKEYVGKRNLNVFGQLR